MFRLGPLELIILMVLFTVLVIFGINSLLQQSRLRRENQRREVEQLNHRVSDLEKKL